MRTGSNPPVSNEYEKNNLYFLFCTEACVQNQGVGYTPKVSTVLNPPRKRVYTTLIQPPIKAKGSVRVKKLRLK